MRLESKPGVAIQSAFVWLTLDEARELRDDLNQLLSHTDDSSWHTHVASADYQVELTVAWDTLAD